jgi:LmbE family N-acetylglucosaminyl deacetylase
MLNKCILILVPHPDDEVVACAAAIGRAQKNDAEVFALYLTHGCIAQETLWPWQRKHYEKFVARRRTEAEECARFLGITPVGWSSRPARHLWRELQVVADEIRTAITAHNINQLWIPAYEGGNADHDGLNAVVNFLVQDFGKTGLAPLPLAGGVGGGLQTEAHTSFSPSPTLSASEERINSAPVALSVLEFAEYNFFNGKANSQAFPYPNGTEQTITLSPEERAKKRAALEIYKSEKQNLNYVRTDRECFRPLAVYDYSKPPHPGTLWYERFHWVPFRHPRVDFTKSDGVTKSITQFIKHKS